MRAPRFMKYARPPGRASKQKGDKMSSLNKVVIVGRLGRDPETSYTPGGIAVCGLNIATDESYTPKDGKKVEKTEWHKVVCFGAQAQNCDKYLTKGSLALVEGSLQTDKWQDKEGNDRYTTKIKAQRVQFLDTKKQGQTTTPDNSSDEPF